MSNINAMIDRTGAVLDYLFKSEVPVGVSNIASNLDFPKATVFRILTTLEKWGIVEKNDQTDLYKLGIVLVKYGAKVSSDLSLVQLAKPIIDKLSNEIGESVNLSIEHLEYSLNIYRSINENSILASKLIPLSSLNCSSSGKIFLSLKSEDYLVKYFDSDFCKKRTNNSIVDYISFGKEKETIKQNNLSYDREEYEYGLSCISSPLFHMGKIVAAISISGPTSRLEIKGFKSIEDKLKMACESLMSLIDFLQAETLF